MFGNHFFSAYELLCFVRNNAVAVATAHCANKAVTNPPGTNATKVPLLIKHVWQTSQIECLPSVGLAYQHKRMWFRSWMIIWCRKHAKHCKTDQIPNLKPPLEVPFKFHKGCESTRMNQNQQNHDVPAVVLVMTTNDFCTPQWVTQWFTICAVAPSDDKLPSSRLRWFAWSSWPTDCHQCLTRSMRMLWLMIYWLLIALLCNSISNYSYHLISLVSLAWP